MTTYWKQLLAEAESLTKENGKSVWRTSQIVRDLFKDQGFAAEACGGKSKERDRKLANLSERFGLLLNDMIQMIECFPERKYWEPGQLLSLRDKMYQMVSKRGQARKKTRQARHVVTAAEHEILKQKLREAKIEIRVLREEVETLRKIAGQPARRKAA